MSQTWDIDTIVPSSTSPFDDITKIINGFDALRSVFSGSSAPSDTEAYMYWADTTTGLLKQRNAADSGWVTRSTLAEAFLLVKSTAYTTLATDRGNTILADATSAGFTVTLVAAATAGDGHELTIKKTDSSANIVTVDANSSETIDGNLTFLLGKQYSSITIRSDGSNWHTTTKNLTSVVQVVNTQTSAVATGTTVIPSDDTIPQNTEGDEYMTLAITPTNTANILVIHVQINLSHNLATSLIAPLFQDSTADAIAVGDERMPVGGGRKTVTFHHYMVAGTTSSTTFKLRAGSSSAGTITVNGGSGTRRYGGVYNSSITITEYEA